MLLAPTASISRSAPAPEWWSGSCADAGVRRGTQACRCVPDCGKIVEDLASAEDPVPYGVLHSCPPTLQDMLASPPPRPPHWITSVSARRESAGRIGACGRVLCTPVPPGSPEPEYSPVFVRSSRAGRESPGRRPPVPAGRQDRDRPREGRRHDPLTNDSQEYATPAYGSFFSTEAESSATNFLVALGSEYGSGGAAQAGEAARGRAGPRRRRWAETV